MLEQVLISGTPNSKRKACTDCFYHQAAVNWWCKNKEAIKYSGKHFGSRKDCKFWKPCKMMGDLTWWDKLVKDYIYVEEDTKP